jgi:hypothetical protein
MSKDQKPEEEKFIPSYNKLESKEKFVTSYDNLEKDNKYKPAYGRPRRSFLNLIIDYYKIILFLIVILILFYLYTEYF